MINTPTEVDHYQLRRVIDVYVSPSSEDLGGLANQVDKIIHRYTSCPRTCASPCAARWKACGSRSRASALA